MWKTLKGTWDCTLCCRMNHLNNGLVVNMVFRLIMCDPSRTICSLLSENIMEVLKHPLWQLKQIVLERQMAANWYLNEVANGSRHKTYCLPTVGTMPRLWAFSMILISVLKFDLICTPTSGPLIHRNWLNSLHGKCFLMMWTNISSISLIKSCLELEIFPQRLAEAYPQVLLVAGSCVKVFITWHIKKHYILMAISILRLWSTTAKSFFHPWHSTGNVLWSIKLVMLCQRSLSSFLLAFIN